MASYKAANVTKYDAGGTGDNYIADGYIKSVEKIWMDSYAVTSAITTADTITIAKIPANKKITSIDVYLPVLGTTTNSTVSIGNSTSATAYGTKSTWDTTAEDLIHANNAGIQSVMSADTDILLAFTSVATTITGGTIKTIVRYT